MQLLSLNFLLYSISGLWRPIEWSSMMSKLLYSVLTFFTIYLLLFMLLSHFLSIIVADNVQDFASTSFMFLSVVSAFSKAITAVAYRDRIIGLIKVLEEKPCKVRNKEENNIQMEYDHLIKSCTLSYMILATGSVMGGMVKGILEGLKGELPYDIRVPWDCTSLSIFWITAFNELVAIAMGAIVNVASETLIFGLILQICSQFEILKHRLQSMVKCREKKIIRKDSLSAALNETGDLSQHIEHHLCIISLAEMVNAIFNIVIFVQFFASLLVLCLSVYYLSHVTITEMGTLVIFAICMFVQIYVYCWAGNEVMLQSTGLSEAVYHIDWTLMTVSEQKDLLMIMRRSTRPIKFTSSFLVTLSLDSFSNLLKTSYSAFNILQQS